MLWVGVANRALEWIGRRAAARLDAHNGLDLDALADAAALLQRTAAGLVLDPGAALPQDASQWLASVTLRSARPELHDGFALPALRAARHRSRLPADLEELLSTALLELALTRAQGVERCAGVSRFETPPLEPAFERDFARRARLEGLLAGATRQCPIWVAGPRAGQYCSKACSNAAFALRKAAREPAYFARKQARYRSAKRRAAARVESAFAFVD